MPAAPTVTICPPLETLDDLELLRSGASRAGDHPIHIAPPPGASPRDPVDVVDPEGVPLLRLHVPDDATADLSLDDHPDWLGELSPRPFEQLYLSPQQARAAASGHTPLLVDRPLAEADLTAYTGRPVLLLVPAGPSVDPDARTLATIRSATAVAATRPGTQVVALPLSPTRASNDPALLETVLQAYAEAPADRLPAAADEPAHGPGGLVLFFTGLSGSGKSTVARAVRNAVLERVGRPITMLDGDVVRRNLSAGLGFSPQDRETNIRRIGWVAAQIAHHGGLAICSPIAPYDATRKAVRQMVHDRGGRFLLVHISTPVEACERRDRKGLYAKARAGEITDFTGISAPYEAPDDADLTLDTSAMSVEDARDRVLSLLDSADLLHARA